MMRVSTLSYGLFLGVVLLIFGGLGLAKEGLYIGHHEGDAAHMVDIVLRILEGQRPHLDFSTPIGLLAFYPIVWASQLSTSLGFDHGLGTSYIAAQFLMGLFFLPMILRVGQSRLGPYSAYLFGFILIIMTVALGHGGEFASLSPSMYYNRWAWVAAFLLVLLAVYPPHRGSGSLIDGVIGGGLMSFLALSKPTFFAALVLPLLLALLLRRAFRELLLALFVGALVAWAMVVLYGPDFFTAYIDDLMSVVVSNTRAAPGASLPELLSGQANLIGTIILLVSIVVLRQSQAFRAGGLLLLFAPGFIYITYQNFGNDPKWLLLLAFYLLAAPISGGARVAGGGYGTDVSRALAVLCFALSMPSLQNMVTSPVRHYLEKPDAYHSYIETRALTRDIYVQTKRTGALVAQQALIDELPALAPYTSENEEFDPVTFQGEQLTFCTLKAGDYAMHSYMADRLKTPPFNFDETAQFFVADVASTIWLIGGFSPLEGGAPWYYSGTKGLENADALIVPLCPLAPDVMREALAAVEASDANLGPAMRDDTMLVYPVLQ